MSGVAGRRTPWRLEVGKCAGPLALVTTFRREAGKRSSGQRRGLL